MIVYQLGYHNHDTRYLIFDIVDNGKEIANIRDYMRERHPRFAELEVISFESAIAYCNCGNKATYGKIFGVENQGGSNGHYFFYVVE